VEKEAHPSVARVVIYGVGVLLFSALWSPENWRTAIAAVLIAGSLLLIGAERLYDSALSS